MPISLNVSGVWRTASSVKIKVSGSWRNVVQGYIKVSGAWRQFFPGTQPYTFYLGNTVHIGTNGYIAFDNGYSVVDAAGTLGRVLGILPADLLVNGVIRWAADSSKFYVFYRGKRLSGGSNFEIEYEVHFTDGQNYALIKLIAFPAITYESTAYYVDGSNALYSTLSSRSVGGEYRVYFDTDAASATTFTEYGSSTAALWLGSSTPTSGTLDDGYFTIVAYQGSSPQAPTSLAASSITKTAATISWDAILNANAGMSAIQSYDYSINSGSTWTSTSTNTSVNITGLTASTSYTVLVRANNYFFIGTNYASVTFTTTAGPVNTVPPTLSTNTGNYSSGSIITVSEGTWTGTTSYQYQILYSSTTPVATSSSFVTANGSNQYTITNTDALAPSYYFRAMVTGYESAGQTGDSAVAYSTATSPRSYIVPTTTIAVGTATATGFTVSGTAGPVSASTAYVSINEIYIYNSSQTLIATITTGLPTVAVSTGSWSYIWTGGAAGTTYYAKVKVASTSSDVQYFTTAFSDSITTATTPGTPTITFSSISTNGFTASWTATNATGYKVSVARNDAGGTYILDNSSTTYNGVNTIATTTATFSSVSTTQSHNVQVQGFNSGVGGAITSRTINAAVTPTFGTNTSTSTGFTGSINNFDTAFTYTTSINTGTLTMATLPTSGSTWTFTVTGLSAGGSATVSASRTRNTTTAASLNSAVGTTTGTATSPTPNVSRIVMTNGGGSTASPNSPRMSITITSTSALSLTYAIYTSSTLPIGSTSAGSGTISTSGTATITTNTGAFNNYYEVFVTPYAASGGGGASGTTKYGGTKRNTTTSTTTTFNV